MNEVDGTEYINQLESFVTRMSTFVNAAEVKIQNAPAAGGLPPAGNSFGYTGMVGNKIPVASQDSAPFGASTPRSGSTGFGSASAPSLGSAGFGGQPLGGAFAGGGGGGGLPSASFGTAASGSGGALPPLSSSGFGATPGAAAGTEGRITPATDRRLQAVIERVVSRMQEFEGLKSQLSRLPQQMFAQIAQRAQLLHDRFLVLQQQGATIAGDGSVPMLERDANQYTSDMESSSRSNQHLLIKPSRQQLVVGSVQLPVLLVLQVLDRLESLEVVHLALVWAQLEGQAWAQQVCPKLPWVEMHFRLRWRLAVLVVMAAALVEAGSVVALAVQVLATTLAVAVSEVISEAAASEETSAAALVAALAVVAALVVQALEASARPATQWILRLYKTV